MAKQKLSRNLSAGILGLLAFIFGVILLRALLSILLQLFVPEIGTVAFSISRRTFTVVLVLFWVGIAAGLVFIIRAVRRRHLT